MFRLSTEAYGTNHSADLGSGDYPLVGDVNGDGSADLGSHEAGWWMSFRFTYAPDVLELLADPVSVLYLSAASSWEIALKWALGRLPLPAPPIEYVPRRMERQGVLGPPVQHRHALRVAALPFHHKDPFDRLLVAQAQIEGLALLTADPRLEAYEGIELLRA